MATKKELEPVLTMNDPEKDAGFEQVKAEVNRTAAKLDDRDAEIERLRRELEDAKRHAAYSSPKDDYRRVKAETERAAKEGLDPWGIKVPIRVPRRPVSEDPWYWININDRAVQIPADDSVQDLKLPWAEALVNQLYAEDRARDFADNLQVFDPVTNPHDD